jgi:hypothetical protein
MLVNLCINNEIFALRDKYQKIFQLEVFVDHSSPSIELINKIKIGNLWSQNIPSAASFASNRVSN